MKERETWVGIRPSVIQNKKKDKKRKRKEGKKECREATKS